MLNTENAEASACLALASCFDWIKKSPQSVTCNAAPLVWLLEDTTGTCFVIEADQKMSLIGFAKNTEEATRIVERHYPGAALMFPDESARQRGLNAITCTEQIIKNAKLL